MAQSNIKGDTNVSRRAPIEGAMPIPIRRILTPGYCYPLDMVFVPLRSILLPAEKLMCVRSDSNLRHGWTFRFRSSAL